MSENKIGYSIPRIVRELLIDELKLSYDQALQFSEKVNSFIKENNPDWLELYDGTTYDLSFTPTKKY
jgi:hypothetical protein